jgi:hypothetical protein
LRDFHERFINQNNQIKELLMPEEFLVQLYEQDGDEIRYNGMLFEAADMGGVPLVGDTVICPLSTRDFGSRDPEKHQSFDVERRYFMPDITKDQPSTVNLVVTRRDLSNAERRFFEGGASAA